MKFIKRVMLTLILIFGSFGSLASSLIIEFDKTTLVHEVILADESTPKIVPALPLYCQAVVQGSDVVTDQNWRLELKEADRYLTAFAGVNNRRPQLLSEQQKTEAKSLVASGDTYIKRFERLSSLPASRMTFADLSKLIPHKLVDGLVVNPDPGTSVTVRFYDCLDGVDIEAIKNLVAEMGQAFQPDGIYQPATTVPIPMFYAVKVTRAETLRVDGQTDAPRLSVEPVPDSATTQPNVLTMPNSVVEFKGLPSTTADKADTGEQQQNQGRAQKTAEELQGCWFSDEKPSRLFSITADGTRVTAEQMEPKRRFEGALKQGQLLLQYQSPSPEERALGIWRDRNGKRMKMNPKVVAQAWPAAARSSLKLTVPLFGEINQMTGTAHGIFLEFDDQLKLTGQQPQSNAIQLSRAAVVNLSVKFVDRTFGVAPENSSVPFPQHFIYLTAEALLECASDDDIVSVTLVFSDQGRQLSKRVKLRRHDYGEFRSPAQGVPVPEGNWTKITVKETGLSISRSKVDGQNTDNYLRSLKDRLNKQ